MTSRDRMLAALRNGTPDRVPTFLCYHGMYVNRHATFEYLLEYRRRMGDAAEYPIDPAEDLEIRRHAIGLVLDLFIGRVDQQFVFPTVREFEATVMTPQLIATAIQYLDTDQYCIIGDGAQVRLEEAAGTGVEAHSRGLETIADVDGYFAPWPSSPAPAPPDTDPYADLRARHAAAVEDSYRCGGVNSPFCMAVGAFGYEGAMLAMHDRPGVFGYFIERALERYLEVVRTADVDGFWFDEYYTDVIAPGHYQEYVHTPNVRLAQALRESGKASTYYFCGDIMPKLEGVCSLQVDAIACEESKKWFLLDLAEVVAVVRGRKALCGNLDGLQLLPRGTPQQIAAEVRRQLDVATRDGGFVMGAGSPIAPDTPLANMRAFLDATREYGVYPVEPATT